MGLDRGGLPVVDTRLWGGLLVTLVVSVTGIVASMPVGIALALGRRSTIPLIRIFSIAFIEFWRGVPLITVLFFATYMLPLFVPAGFTIDGLVRALIGIALFAGAYQAENIRGGLQAIPRGQGEAASALGLSWAKTTALIVMPQALRHVIPSLVNSFIGLFKDTSLVSIVALFDLLGTVARFVFRSGLVDADHAVHRLCLHRDHLFRVLLWHVALLAVRREQAERASPQLSVWTMSTDSIVGINGPQQMVRRFSRAARHQPRCRQGRAHRDLRPVGLGQVDADPLHQRAGGIPGRRRSSSTASNSDRTCGGSTRSGAKSAWCSRVSTCFRI